ncbi:hypothetical protein VPH35_140186 [Triticum aestivum]|uniref:Uncharacterized protein n=1 Tax=Aegilops tauschii TaxID=37682 RepID=R7VYW9_AEGTA
MSHGTAHWLAWCPSFDVDGLCTIDVDLKTCQVSLTKIAIPREYVIPRETHDRPQLSVTVGGTLLLLHLQRPGLRLDIWTQQDDGGSEDGGHWLCTPDVELKLPEKHADINTSLVHLNFLGENSGSGTLFLKDNCGYVYTVDLENKVIEELMEMDMDYERINCQEVVPFQMDLKRFLTSRLRSRLQI